MGILNRNKPAPASVSAPSTVKKRGTTASTSYTPKSKTPEVTFYTMGLAATLYDLFTHIINSPTVAVRAGSRDLNYLGTVSGEVNYDFASAADLVNYVFYDILLPQGGTLEIKDVKIEAGTITFSFSWDF